MEKLLLRFGVGPLLYCPASNRSVADSIINEKFGRGFSLALCLEDTIDDTGVEEAEKILIHTMQAIANACQEQAFYLPKIFIRVRRPGQISDLYKRLGTASLLLWGFTIPKFSRENADDYIGQILKVNDTSNQPVYMMPIIESPTVIDPRYRSDILYGLKDKLDMLPELVLNVRVGGNDLCHTFGFRRQSTESIYDISPVAGILSDAVTVFGLDYILSGPVWEYYDGFRWKEGLEAELQKDRLNGFVGKTVIHPKQIDSVNRAYMVSRSDYEDAISILNWDPNTKTLVAGSLGHARMNEKKTHSNWARKIIALSQAYGIAEES